MYKDILEEYKEDGFVYKFLKEDDIDDILLLEDENTKPEVFVKITRQELLESVKEDFVIGVYSENILAGFCLMIKNRATSRSLAPDIKEKSMDTVTFDAVVVNAKYRGHALQKKFISLCCDIARSLTPAPKFMAATVSPNNSFSKRNFLQSGFVVKDEKEKYGGNLRLVVAKEI